MAYFGFNVRNAWPNTAAALAPAYMDAAQNVSSTFPGILVMSPTDNTAGADSWLVKRFSRSPRRIVAAHADFRGSDNAVVPAHYPATGDTCTLRFHAHAGGTL